LEEWLLALNGSLNSASLLTDKFTYFLFDPFFLGSAPTIWN